MTTDEVPRDTGSRYLWDRTGSPEDEVVRLERLLAPLKHRATSFVPPTSASRPASRALAWIPFGVAAAALLALGASTLQSRPAPVPAPEGGQAASRTQVPHVVDDLGARIVAGSWIRTGAEPREMVLADIGTVTVHPDSRLEVTRLTAEGTRMFLEHGRIEARIGANVRPRFFQVGTAAANCVDLGCRYELTAEPDGSSKVTVLTGRVAFEADGKGGAGREVLVPARAVCFATKARGPGTPRYAHTPAGLVAVVDAFDAAATGTKERLEHAKAAAEVALSNDDLLPLWHWLTDDDAEVARVALARLRERVGDPEGWNGPAARPGTAERDAFRGPLGLDTR